MKLSKILIIAILISVLLLSFPVFANELLSGEITAPASYISSNYKLVPIGSDGNSLYCVTQIAVKNIEYTAGTSALIHFDTDNSHISSYAAGAPAGAQTSFTLYDGGNLVGSGEIGYQRKFTLLGVEQAGFQYLTFSQWDITGLSGNKVLTLNFDRTVVPLAGMKYGQWAAYTPTPPTGYLAWGDGVEGTSVQACQWTTYNKAFAFENSYSVTKGLGLGIVGSVWKHDGSGIIYNSKAFIINATDYTTVTSEATLSPTVFYFNIPTESIIIALLDANGDWHNTTALFTVAPYVPGAYSITVNPSTITLPSGVASGNIIATSVDLAKLIDITWWGNDATGGTYYFYENGDPTRPLGYRKISGTWYGFNPATATYSYNKGTSIPNPVTINNISSAGITSVTCFIGTSDDYWYTLTAPLTIQQGGIQNLEIDVQDFETGALISNTELSVRNIATGLWSNVTAPSGLYHFFYPYNSQLYVEARATGYVTATRNQTVRPIPADALYILLFHGQTPLAANVTMNILVQEYVGLDYIPGALVHVYASGQNGESKLTSAAGVATFNTSENTDYIVSVSKYGYQSAAGIINTGPGGTAISRAIYLQRAVAPTPTVTVPTTVPTGIPTMVGGNYTGFWGPLYNMWSAMGADAFTMQLLMASFFVFCGVCVGGFGMGTIIPGSPFSGTGAEAGGVFAFILACAFGFISVLWIVVVIVWVAFRYFLIK